MKLHLPKALIILSALFIGFHSFGQVAVNTDNSEADASAILDVKSVSSGFLIPRMDAAARTGISNPATGLIVFQTEAPVGFYYYNGISWQKIAETVAETDPVFSAWNKSLGISITSSQVSNFNTAVSAVPAVVANTAKVTYPPADAAKLAGIEAGAEVNVNADWDAVSGDAQILNKPAITGLLAPQSAANGSLICFNGSNWVARTLVVNISGSSIPINNYQPYLAIRFCMALQGIYPSRNSSEPHIGEICMFPYDFDPRFFASCNGQLLSIAQNSALYSLLGTYYGGNGTTNFALPDLRGRSSFLYGQGPGLSNYPMGYSTGSANTTLIQSNLPLHTHTVTFN